ncbi:MAG TPA: glycoside hydrolase, partial [Ruminococcus sp.]|nr:glycoside hydrolase [Ruminococcus sp.]HCR74148.1 glycoside hydrolase [Ruminococcus sp.]
MKSAKKIIAVASMAAVSLCGFICAFGSSTDFNETVSAVADDNNDDWLHTDGSRIYDIDGNEVWLTGANWFGFNCTENCAHGLYAADCDDFLANVADMGINVIRMPISTELLVSWMNGTPDAVSSVNAANNPPYIVINPDFVEADGKTLKNSMEIFDVIMQKMKAHGLKVIVDVHSPASHNSGHNYNLWYYEDSAEDAGNMAVGHFSSEQITYDMWKDSLAWLAEKYNNDDTIIAYDLKNEPHGKRGYSGTECPSSIAKWDDSTDLNNWAYSATDCANAILDVNPNALILIEGVEQYPKTEKGYTYDTADIWQASAEVSPWYGAWWGGNLRGVKDYPITLKTSQRTKQIVYSPHDYGPSVYNQTWFDKDFTTQTLLDDYWYDTWAYIEDQNIAPLLIGEWGGHMDGGKNQKWMELLRDYMIDNHINHTFWGLNPNSGDTGGLLSYDFMTIDEEKYGLFEESLWQTSKTGKYIGLDHKTALGKNGISLSDYYSTYVSSEGSNLEASGEKHPLDPSAVPEVTTTSKVTEETTEAPATTAQKPETTTAAPETTTEQKTETSAVFPQTSESISELPEASMLGDVTLDNEIDVRDVTLLNQYIVKMADLTEKQIANGDVISDGKVDLKDLGQVKKYLIKVIEKF